MGGAGNRHYGFSYQCYRLYIYVFRDELFIMAHKDVLFNNVNTKQPSLAVSQLWQTSQQHIGV